MFALLPLDLFFMLCGEKNALRLEPSQMNAGLSRSYPGPLCPHRFETYDFGATYPNRPDATIQDAMRKLLDYTLSTKSTWLAFDINTLGFCR